MRTVRTTTLVLLAALLLAPASCGDSDYWLYISTWRLTTVLTLEDQSGNPADTFSAGEPVTMTLTVTNKTEDTVFVQLGGQQFDLIVARASDEAVVWRWSSGKGFPAVIEDITLHPGDSLVFEETWDQTGDDGNPVPARDYLAQGFLATSYELSRPGLRTGGGARSWPVEFTIN